jgi:hypothetical protein
MQKQRRKAGGREREITNWWSLEREGSCCWSLESDRKLVIFRKIDHRWRKRTEKKTKNAKIEKERGKLMLNKESDAGIVLQ